MSLWICIKNDNDIGFLFKSKQDVMTQKVSERHQTYHNSSAIVKWRQWINYLRPISFQRHTTDNRIDFLRMMMIILIKNSNHCLVAMRAVHGIARILGRHWHITFLAVPCRHCLLHDWNFNLRKPIAVGDVNEVIFHRDLDKSNPWSSNHLNCNGTPWQIVSLDLFIILHGLTFSRKGCAYISWLKRDNT